MPHLPIWIERRLTAPDRGFGPACQGEASVYGARRPGFPLPVVSPAAVDRWIATVRAAGVERVVCLLASRQLRGYADLLAAYRREFGAAQVCWAPVEDFRLIKRELLLDQVLPALFAAERDGARSVVHCSGGIGRTGHVLAAWLVSARGMGNEEAIAAVRRTGRNPRESRDPGLDALLDAARARFAQTDQG
ncbi:MAG TPA: dual specificity protein phosphatase family protein [Herpetosiphonaceae bacterium]|nr:dual specificity protein phosphatase family protein [Herpetosiphonaceae bacterium]